MVVETGGTLTYIGRFDTEDERGVHLLDVGVHDAGAGGSREDYVRRSANFGVRAERPHLVVPRGEVVRITKLGETAQ
ncbi:MAG: hypothetical protein H0T50_11990 [Gemmatimonadales bacterium]|nr:hypothetical protein [Gemmatimonadales bacterium]